MCVWEREQQRVHGLSIQLHAATYRSSLTYEEYNHCMVSETLINLSVKSFGLHSFFTCLRFIGWGSELFGAWACPCSSKRECSTEPIKRSFCSSGCNAGTYAIFQLSCSHRVTVTVEQSWLLPLCLTLYFHLDVQIITKSWSMDRSRNVASGHTQFSYQTEDLQNPLVEV